MTGGRARLLRAVVIGAVGVGLAFALREIAWAEVGRALRSARAWPIVVAAVINFGIIVGKAAAWKLLLAPAHRISLGRLTRYTLVACAGSIVLPLRAGELVRGWLLRDRDGVPTARIAAVAVAEKLLDMLSMSLMLVPLPWLLPELPGHVASIVAVVAGLAIAVMLALRVASQRVTGAHWLARMVAGFALLDDLPRVVAVLGVLVGTWLIDLTMITLVLHAVGLAVPSGGALVVLLGVNLAIALPSTPGQLGALELGAMAGLHLLHAAPAPAVAFAVLYHVLQVVPVLAVALITDGKLLGRGTQSEGLAPPRPPT